MIRISGNIMVWRGIDTPPTTYHLWEHTQDDGTTILKRYEGGEWKPVTTDTEAIYVSCNTPPDTTKENFPKIWFDKCDLSEGSGGNFLPITGNGAQLQHTGSLHFSTNQDFILVSQLGTSSVSQLSLTTNITLASGNSLFFVTNNNGKIYFNNYELIQNGDGTKFLADDGTYKTVSGGGNYVINGANSAAVNITMTGDTASERIGLARYKTGGSTSYPSSYITLNDNLTLNTYLDTGVIYIQAFDSSAQNSSGIRIKYDEVDIEKGSSVQIRLKEAKAYYTKNYSSEDTPDDSREIAVLNDLAAYLPLTGTGATVQHTGGPLNFVTTGNLVLVSGQGTPQSGQIILGPTISIFSDEITLDTKNSGKVTYNGNEVATVANALMYTTGTNGEPVLALRNGTKISESPLEGGVSHEILGINTYTTSKTFNQFEIGSQSALFCINVLYDEDLTLGHPTVDVYNSDGTRRAQELIVLYSDLKEELIPYRHSVTGIISDGIITGFPTNVVVQSVNYNRLLLFSDDYTVDTASNGNVTVTITNQDIINNMASTDKTEITYYL